MQLLKCISGWGRGCVGGGGGGGGSGRNHFFLDDTLCKIT